MGLDFKVQIQSKQLKNPIKNRFGWTINAAKKSRSRVLHFALFICYDNNLKHASGTLNS